MMSETVLQTAVCDSCGADVRDESLFCYNCGERVSREIPVIEALLEKPEAVIQPGSRPPLNSAASLRKQRRASNRQPVEVSWEQRTDSPAGFVIATIVLVVGALVLLVIALYLR
jgi:predicted amidophosphoribosyltransferase